MAKLTAPLLSLSAFGTIARTLTFRRRKRQTIAEKKPIPMDALTAIQRAQRLLFQDAVAWWHALTEPEKQAYDKPGREHHMSGYAWFIRTYLLNPPAATFLSLTDTPAAYAGEAGHSPKVNAGETALDWSTIKEHASGIIDLPGQSGAKAYRAATNQTIPPSEETKVQLNAESWDVQNEFDPTTNYRFTALQSGKYLVSCSVRMDAMQADKRCSPAIKVNGATKLVSTMTVVADDAAYPSIAGIVSLTPGDYVELFVWHNNSVAKVLVLGEPYTNLVIAKVA